MKQVDYGYFGLSDLIEYLEGLNPSTMLKVGFSNPHSWRGVYSDLAFEPTVPQTAATALSVIKPCLGATFEGYKGGDNNMHESTECHFAFYGSGGGQPIGHMLMVLLTED